MSERAVFFAICLCVVFVGIGSRLKADNSSKPPLVSSDGHKIVSEWVRNDAPNLPVMTFYVRYPTGLSPGDKVKGVFADVIWLSEDADLRQWIERPSEADPNFQFADQHHLAIVTWTTATEYSIADSFTGDAREETDPGDSMEQCFRTWKIAMDRICRNYNLPSDGYLIYGESRGAQWAHRIVLRDPDKFLAIHINVNSSFEQPNSDASRCLWLVTTGELEHGSSAAQVFFHDAQALNYPILLRIYPGKAHEVFPEEVTLGLKFFDYALKLKDTQIKLAASQQASGVTTDTGDQPFVLDESLLSGFRQPPFYGDMINGDVYPTALSDLVPASQRVGLPNLDIAKDWGYFHP
jgi:hypothetical protein